MTPKSGRRIAWLSFVLGIAVSVAGNVLHSALTPAGPGELFGAAFWPLALMLSIENLTRVRWQFGRWWMAARVIGLLLVGIVAAVLSYRHLAGLMTSWGEDRFNAHLGPLAVDGLMLLAATALLSISREAKPFIPWTETSVMDTTPLTGAPASLNDLKADPVIATDLRVEEYPDGSIGYTAKPVPAKEPSRLHVVSRVSDEDAISAARQAWIDSGREMSSQQVANLAGVSKSTAHRRIGRWTEELNQVSSPGRRIER